MYKIIITVLVVLVPSFAFSVPCTELADTFAKNPDSMSVNELEALRNCVTEKIRYESKVKRVPLNAPAPLPPTGPVQAPREMLPPAPDNFQKSNSE